MLELDAPIPAPGQDIDAEPEPDGQDVTANPEPDGQEAAVNLEPDAQDVEPEAEPSGEKAWTICSNVWPHCGGVMSGPKSGANFQAEPLLPLPNCRTERRHYTCH